MDDTDGRSPRGSSGSLAENPAEPDRRASSATKSDGASEPQGRRHARVADLLPSVTLPKSGGAIRGLGEKFAVNAATGTCSLDVPLPLSQGRSGFTPQLGLSYDSGSGNGPFGFGWSLDLPAITRKTDKGLPRYCDGEESDVFILSGSEDLVPVLDAAGRRKAIARTVHGRAYQVYPYRPRVESLFARIERWLDPATGLSYWRSISRSNLTTLYGWDATSRVADPVDPKKVFSWRISRSWDDRGNVAVYTYAPEDSAGIDTAQAHEANRSVRTRAAQGYIKTIRYGNVQPYLPDWTSAEPAPLPSDWLFYVVFDYGDHAPAAPGLTPDRAWALRPDPFSSYRSGFEIRTYRRVQRALFFNDFRAEATAGPACLARSLDLRYSDQQYPVDLRNPLYTLLVAVTETGYRNDAGTTVSRAMPPLEFDYSQPQFDPQVRTLDRDSAENLPEGLDARKYQWVDLEGEGLSGILSDAGGAWYYKRNSSANNRVPQPDGTLVARARFGPLKAVPRLPAASNLGGPQQLMDLSGAGLPDLVELADPDPGFYGRAPDGSFEPFRGFLSAPQLDYASPNVKLIDLTGDGLADILVTEDGLYTFFNSLGEIGFDPPQVVRTPWDEEKGPAVILSDGSETIFIADMTGDGLNDIVRVRNGEACYWPNIGYGRFGTKVTMDRAPRFDSEERFDPRRIRLADIDGTGNSDLLYIGADGVRAWFNQSGNSWSAATVIGRFPTEDLLGSVQAIDLLGNGTACLVWSSPLPDQSRAPLRYVDLMSGQKPHLLVRARNNLGAETRLTYSPSTRFYLDDRAAGRPWITRLPFPVQVVERSEIVDWIGRGRLVSRYAYHHGYFDGYEREFRGFGMVERWDTEEFHADVAFSDPELANWNAQSFSPPVLTRSWFHTGVFAQAIAVSRIFAHEYWIEPAHRTPQGAAGAVAMQLPDTVIPDGLNPFEVQEAYRALKGRAIRTEVYGRDGSPRQDDPYTVTEQNFTIVCLQRMGANLHACFMVHPRETVSFHYERAGTDPRVTHDLTLECDLYGNVRRSASVAYPRRSGNAPPEPGLSAAFQGMLAYDQQRLHARAIALGYTNPIDDIATWPDAYRAPAPGASDEAELTGIAPAASVAGITPLFTFDDWNRAGGVWQTAWSGGNDIAYEAIPAADVDGTGTAAATTTRRIVRRSRTLYRRDDLTALLPAGQLEPRALPGESYEAALTDTHLATLFGPLITPAILAEGGYVQLAGESGWWMPSGRVWFSPGDTDTPAVELATALAHFFSARRAKDPFGATTRLAFDAYDLLPAALTDPVGNVTSAVNDYRVLAPNLVTDPNGNRTALAFDALGLVTATAVMGKTSEALGDGLSGFQIDLDELALAAQFAAPLANPSGLLGSATTRVILDINAYLRTRDSVQPSPPAAYTLSRETHVSDLASTGGVTLYQYHLNYSDGFGREIQSKSHVADGPIVPGGPVATPRWAGSGWTIYDNKGRTVRRYEPFFSGTHAFEFAAQSGVATVLFYDPPGRTVAALHPDNSWEKTSFDAWSRTAWDGNDTVLISDPRLDVDVEDFFRRLLGSGAGLFTSWHDLRINGTYGSTPEQQAAQQDAAQKTEAHAGTPAVAHFDSLGRICLGVVDNGNGLRFASRTALDTEGKPLAVIDALGRRAQEYVFRAPQPGGGFQYIAGTDMAGIGLYQNHADAGARLSFTNVAQRMIRLWDARQHAFRFVYDAAQRLIERHVSTAGAAEILIDVTVYGENAPALAFPAANLCGHVYRVYDMAGVASHDRYDYKGNLAAGSRIPGATATYWQAIDWTPLQGLTAPAALDAAGAPLLATADAFVSSTVFDALNRPIQMVTPYSSATRPNVIQQTYDAGAFLSAVDVWLQQASAPTGLLSPATADRHAISALIYNARGQRLQATFGNGVVTSYAYDAQTFRLAQLTTTRPSSYPANQRVVQALLYFYDPVGNITTLRDDADTQDVIYFMNQRVEPSASYAYDPLYRLTSATGREHLGQNGGILLAPQQVTNDDSTRVGFLSPSDGTAMGRYAETYAYDAAGNLQSMGHQVSSGSWTRYYTCGESSRIVSSEAGNRTSTTSNPGDPSGGPYTAHYSYDEHGNTTAMPHLPAMTWDEDDRLRSTTRQVVASGTPETTYCTYDSGGQRVCKATRGQAAAGQTPALLRQRLYLGAVEIYREFAPGSTPPTLQREVLHVMAAGEHIVMVETRTLGTDKAPQNLVRYQYPNHLNSALLELDDQAAIITYEEFFPYGATSYQATSTVNQAALPKRYRYAGRERDQENDLYFIGARYYACWLGNWVSLDPLWTTAGSQYQYASRNPVCRKDADGRDDHPVTQPDAGTDAGAAAPDAGAAAPDAGMPDAGAAQAPPKARKTIAVNPGSDFAKALRGTAPRSGRLSSQTQLPSDLNQALADSFAKSHFTEGGQAKIGEIPAVLALKKNGELEYREGERGEPHSSRVNREDVAAGERLVGVSHTHPYENGGDNPYPSKLGKEGDIYVFLKDKPSLFIIRGEQSTTVLVRTKEFDDFVRSRGQARADREIIHTFEQGESKVMREIMRKAEQEKASGKADAGAPSGDTASSFAQVQREAIEEVARQTGLAVYVGPNGGTLTRIGVPARPPTPAPKPTPARPPVRVTPPAHRQRTIQMPPLR